MKLAAFQFDVRRGEHAHNLAEVERGLREARELGVELVLLPEMWASSFPDAGADLERLAAFDERSQQRVLALSAELELAVCGTTFGASAARKPANRWRLVERGFELARYDKTHLFSPTAEPEGFAAGDEPPPFVSLRGVRISGCVCYDARFVQLTARFFLGGAELVLIPAQWPATRASHFRALMHGLAVQNQCFVLAANRTGRESLGRRGLELEFPGNSLLADPHGRTLAEGDGAPGLVGAAIELDEARELRRRVPVARDSREALYERWNAIAREAR